MIIMIGYDRYNVIVKGFSGVKITPCIALLMITFSFTYSTGVCIVPFLEVWGSYKLGIVDMVQFLSNSIPYYFYLQRACY